MPSRAIGRRRHIYLSISSREASAVPRQSTPPESAIERRDVPIGARHHQQVDGEAAKCVHHPERHLRMLYAATIDE